MVTAHNPNFPTKKICRESGVLNTRKHTRHGLTGGAGFPLKGGTPCGIPTQPYTLGEGKKLFSRFCAVPTVSTPGRYTSEMWPIRTA